MSRPAALLQRNAVPGDLSGACGRLAQAARAAQTADAMLLLAPELTLTGTQGGRLFSRRSFQKDVRDALDSLAARLASEGVTIPVLAGAPADDAGKACSALWLLENGSARPVASRRNLEGSPAEGLVPGTGLQALEIEGLRFAAGFAADAGEALPEGAQALLLADASSWTQEAEPVPESLRSSKFPVLCARAAGAEGPVIHSGASFVLSPGGEPQVLPRFAESLMLADPETGKPVRELDLPWKTDPAPVDGPETPEKELWQALVLSIRDYVKKSGFSDVVLGLSGGVDSALVTSLACDALGAEHVTALMMPTRFTADESFRGAKQLSENLGIRYEIRPIEPVFTAFRELLRDDFAGLPWDASEENLQARVRGTLLMAWSNKFGPLVLVTGNRSEAAVGYSTLYGDTAGAFAPIIDVWKTQVWRLCRWRNEAAGCELIPEEIISRAPSAELREGQTDQQSLPDYETLDGILSMYLDRGLGRDEIVSRGQDSAQVDRVLRMLAVAQYKRAQCPPGPRVSRGALSGAPCLPLQWRGKI